MSDMRTRLKGLGINEARLASLGLGATPTTAPAATEPTNIFARKYAEHVTKASTPKAPVLPDAKAAMDAAKVFEQYEAGNAIERAYLREHHGAAVELGRRITLIDSPESPPEPPKAA
jgi:hypothetical protein